MEEVVVSCENSVNQTVLLGFVELDAFVDHGSSHFGRFFGGWFVSNIFSTLFASFFQGIATVLIVLLLLAAFAATRKVHVTTAPSRLVSSVVDGQCREDQKTTQDVVKDNHNTHKDGKAQDRSDRTHGRSEEGHCSSGRRQQHGHGRVRESNRGNFFRRCIWILQTSILPLVDCIKNTSKK